MNPYAMKKMEIASVLSLVPPGSLDNTLKVSLPNQTRQDKLLGV